MTDTAPRAGLAMGIEAAIFAGALGLALWLAWTVGRCPLRSCRSSSRCSAPCSASARWSQRAGLSLRGSGLAAAIVLAATLTVDLSVNNGPSESTALPSQTYDVLRADSTQRDDRAAETRDGPHRRPDRRDRIELAGIDFHWPNASLVHELDNTLGYNPLQARPLQQGDRRRGSCRAARAAQFSPLMPSYRSLLADMLGLAFIATGVPVEQIDKNLKPGDLTQIARTKDAYVYENPRALPRVLLVTDRRRRPISTRS
jgi:hypothetical protein